MNVAVPIARHALKHATAVASTLVEHDELLREVEATMSRLAGEPSADPGARMACEHLDTGGKRLRARLALACCHALGGYAEDAVPWAASVELLHNATLIHDDIQDGDRTRRGQPALWMRYGAAQAINTGDLLLMLPFRALGAYPAEAQAALGQILAQYAESTVRGQIRELALTAASDKGWGDYFDAVSGKTGTMFALPVRGAAELAGVMPDEAEALASTFRSIGVLYQLQDDLLDLYDAKGRGRRGSDIFEGRLSAVVLTHLDRHPDDAQSLFELLGRPRAHTPPAQVHRLIDRFIACGTAAHLRARIELLASELLEADTLRGAPDMQAVASALVARVMTPLESIEGGAS